MNKPILINVVMAAVVTSLLLVSCKKNQFGNDSEKWFHFINKDTAAAWVARYDAKHENSAGRADTNNLRLLSYADDFKKGKWMMGTMMSRKEVVGFRIYHGIRPDGVIVPILVGLDVKGNDIYWKKEKTSPSSNTKSKIGTQAADPVDDEYEYGAMDMSQKAPPPPMNMNSVTNTNTTIMLLSPDKLSQRQ